MLSAINRVLPYLNFWNADLANHTNVRGSRRTNEIRADSRVSRNQRYRFSKLKGAI